MQRRLSTPTWLAQRIRKFIQQVCGKFLFYGKAADSTILTSLSAIASQQTNPTTDTMAKVKQLLDYLASQEEATLTYSASDVILAVHSNARSKQEAEQEDISSYLPTPQSQQTTTPF